MTVSPPASLPLCASVPARGRFSGSASPAANRSGISAWQRSQRRNFPTPPPAPEPWLAKRRDPVATTSVNLSPGSRNSDELWWPILVAGSRGQISSEGKSTITGTRPPALPATAVNGGDSHSTFVAIMDSPAVRKRARYRPRRDRGSSLNRSCQLDRSMPGGEIPKFIPLFGKTTLLQPLCIIRNPLGSNMVRQFGTT